MIARTELKRKAAKTLRGLQLMLFGALVLAMWLEASGRGVEHLFWSLFMAALLAGWVAEILTPQAGRPLRSPSPRASGVGVIVVTGMVATIALSKGDMFGEPNPIAAAVIAICTIAASVAMWRFATRHAHEIGEARFATESGKPSA